MTYRRSLNGLRAIAVFAVIGLHTETPFLRGGGLGVNVFFALSGYLITTLLLTEDGRNGRVDLPRFYARRALRLYPALLLVSLGLLLWVVTGHGSREDVIGVVAAVTYTTDWLRALTSHTGGAMGHTWSLAVEEQFYLLWPLALIFAVRRGGARAVAVAAAGLAVAALLLRVALWSSPASFPRVYNGLDTQADQLLWGCALGALASIYPAAVSRACRVFLLPALVVLVVAAVHGVPTTRSVYTLGYSVFAVSAAVVVGHLALRDGWLNSALAAAPVHWLGRISYGIYLWHYPVLALLHTSSWPMRLVVTTLLSVAAAALSFYLVELPLQRRLRPRLVPASRKVVLTG